MIYSILVKSNYDENNFLLQKSYGADTEKLNADIQLCVPRSRISSFKALLIPVRTNTVSNFCKDMFLPSFCNVALKANGVASKIFLGIIMITLDSITLSIRLITVIPRAVYNSKHSLQSDLFYQFLIREGVPANSLRAGHVYIEMSRIVKKGEKYNLESRGETYDFMELPRSVSKMHRQLGNQQKNLTEKEIIECGYSVDSLKSLNSKSIE